MAYALPWLGLALLGVGFACGAPDVITNPPEGVTIEIGPPEAEPDAPDPARPEGPAEVEPPPELAPRPVRLRQRPEIVERGWRQVRTLAPGTNAAQTTLANPAYIASLFARAVVREDAALLSEVLHPQAALPMPGRLAHAAAGQVDDSGAWRQFWWRLRVALYSAIGVDLWGGAVPHGDGGASVAVVLSPATPEQPLRTVLLLATVPPNAADPRQPPRWGVLDVQVHLRPDAVQMAQPTAAQFPLDAPQPQLFPQAPIPEVRRLDAASVDNELDEAIRTLVRQLEQADAAMLEGLSEALGIGLGLGTRTSAERALAAEVLGAPPASAGTLARRLHASLADAPQLQAHALLRLYRTWDGEALVAEAAVVLDGTFGFPRWYGVRWLAPAGEADVLPRAWRLIGWEPWLTEAERELLAPPEPPDLDAPPTVEPEE